MTKPPTKKLWKRRGGGGERGRSRGRSKRPVRSGRGPGTTGSTQGGSGGTGRSPVSSTSSFGSGKADFFSPGGGNSFTLGSWSPFSGRLAGGGYRESVAGTQRYGSGYPYGYMHGNSHRTGTFGLPFPFGFWPLYCPHYGYSHEYGQNSTVAQMRPGGDLVQAAIAPNATQWYISQEAANNETYWLLGDRESLTAMLQVLSGCKDCETYSCGIVNVTDVQPMTLDLGNFTTSNGTVVPVNSSTAPPQVQNIVQYYRASSFALAYTNYTNTYAVAPLNETTEVGWGNSTVLPDLLTHSAFLQCVNSTLVDGLPILNAAGKTKVMGFQLGAVVCAAVGAALLNMWL
ncbi:hypothetical protein CPB86DRAFT_786207 [Serendipita vermifera]|nr:hypothetical protein CPB86DRAFT_786207 [Serendipita vermifera]